MWTGRTLSCLLKTARLPSSQVRTSLGAGKCWNASPACFPSVNLTVILLPHVECLYFWTSKLIVFLRSPSASLICLLRLFYGVSTCLDFLRSMSENLESEKGRFSSGPYNFETVRKFASFYKMLRRCYL